MSCSQPNNVKLAAVEWKSFLQLTKETAEMVALYAEEDDKLKAVEEFKEIYTQFSEAEAKERNSLKCIEEINQLILNDEDNVEDNSDSDIENVEIGLKPGRLIDFDEAMTLLEKKIAETPIDTNFKQHPFYEEFKGVVDILSNDCPLVTETTENYIDPLTKMPIQSPVVNQLCGHNYEKRSIMNYLKKKKVIRCPYVGCKVKEFTRHNLVENTKLADEIRNKMESQKNDSIQLKSQDEEDVFDVDDIDVDE